MNETTRERIERERNERKAQSDLRDFARQSNDINQGRSAGRLINAERREQMVTRVRQVMAPPNEKPNPRRNIPAEAVAPTTFSHPWKVTCSEDDITVAPGMFFSVRARNNSVAYDTHGWDFVEKPVEYAGGTFTGLSGTKYVYAKCELSTFSTSEYIYGTGDNGFSFEVRSYALIGDITVYTSDDDPSVEGVDNSAGTGYWIKPIAKIVVTDGIAAVEKQYLTHNPSMHLNLIVGAV